MTTAPSAIYYGEVVHQRVRPRRHRLQYRVFSLLLDLDDLTALHRRCRLFAHNGFNLFSFRDADHGSGEDGALRTWVEEHLARAGVTIDGGRIEVLCYPRILGYVFNPLTVYYAYSANRSLAAIVYEVRNTFGERHSYVIPVRDDQPGVIRQSCDKVFYVSPFNTVAGSYRFRMSEPRTDVGVVVNYHDDQGMILHAAFRGRRGALTDRALLSAFLRYPLMTLKVIVGIHWEAFALWRKGLRLKSRPAPPAEPVTIVASDSSAHP